MSCLTIAEAAKRLGKGKQFVRLALQSGKAPFGFAVKNGDGKWSFDIREGLLNEYIRSGKNSRIKRSHKGDQTFSRFLRYRAKSGRSIIGTRKI